MMRLYLAALLVIQAAFAATARAQPDPSGISFVTVGSPNNPAYNRDDPQGLITGRGSVPYSYRMGQFEVTTSQWLDFYNTFKARPDAVSDSVLPTPLIWGAQVDPNYGGPGTRYRLNPGDPNAGMRFTAGITWRVAAMFCNWECNQRSSVLTAIQNGAYDTSTFQEPMRGVFTDQVQHNPGAQYWIPTLDEWAKASFYDPTANGGQGGWWLNQYGRDRQPVAGPPPSMGGNGETNTGFQLPGNAQYTIPLGAYSGVGSVSPWGLLDTAGATTEWLEERLVTDIGQTFRYTGGSSSPLGQPDWAYGYGAENPADRVPWTGLRIASSIPGPSSIIIICGAICFGAQRRKRRSVVCAVVSSRSSSDLSLWDRQPKQP
jgi:formylglycine-generating enzyme required for sulfatase activity